MKTKLDVTVGIMVVEVGEEKRSPPPLISLAAFGHTTCLSAFQKSCVGMRIKPDAAVKVMVRRRESPFAVADFVGGVFCLLGNSGNADHEDGEKLDKR